MPEIMDLLVENELAVARFYRLCAERFAALKDFWSGLADQEEDHGQWIRQLKAEIKEGGAEYKPEKVKPIAVQSSINYLNEQSTRLENGGLSLVNALSIAVNIERSVFESRIFDAFSGYSQAAKKLIADLKQALLDHNELVDRKWQEYRYSK
jgi:rubrerythrin